MHFQPLQKNSSRIATAPLLRFTERPVRAIKQFNLADRILTSGSIPFFFLLVSLISACRSGSPATTYLPIFTETENTLFKISEDQDYTFGYLEVPENRSMPNSRTIKLPVYIFKSRNPKPQSDPIIYTVGGPGGSTMPNAPYMEYYRYLSDRDFILFEQRGTQYAQPHLDCPEWAEAVYRSKLPGFTESRSDSLFTKAATDCRKRLVSRGIDLNGYNTREIAADIADLRKVLGLKEYNLLTISYSTKIAQVLLRDHPEGIRSVVMDSALPLEVSYDEESVDNLLTSIEKLLSDCESEPGCQTAFPNIRNRFFDYLRAITEDPLVVNVDNPVSGKEETFLLRGKDMITFFANVSSSEVPDLPQEIWKILNNDLSTVRALLADLFEGPGAGNGQGMRLSVWCAEEFPFVSVEKVDAVTQAYPSISGLSPVVFTAEVCNIWRVQSESRTENQAVKSDIPVLLINGEYDYDTPPKWAAAMQKNLPNSYHFVFKRWKHIPTTYWSNPCAMELANTFFNDPDTKPAVDCFQDLQEVRFRVE
jgi:pimeloyl-ACP methyl ester carboxylesterase